VFFIKGYYYYCYCCPASHARRHSRRPKKSEWTNESASNCFSLSLLLIGASAFGAKNSLACNEAVPFYFKKHSVSIIFGHRISLQAALVKFCMLALLLFV